MLKRLLIVMILVFSIFAGIASAGAEVSISPSEPIEGDNLYCYVNGEIKPGFEYTWHVNNADYAENPLAYEIGKYSAGDTVTCYVRVAGQFGYYNIGSDSVVIGAKEEPVVEPEPEPEPEPEFMNIVIIDVWDFILTDVTPNVIIPLPYWPVFPIDIDITPDTPDVPFNPLVPQKPSFPWSDWDFEPKVPSDYFPYFPWDWDLPEVENQPPFAHAKADPKIAYVGDVIEFDASESYDVDGEIVNYVWDFGENYGAINLVNPIHMYNTIGKKKVILTVTDDDGAVDSTFVYVLILERDEEVVEDLQKNLDWGNKYHNLEVLEVQTFAVEDGLNVYCKLSNGGAYVENVMVELWVRDNTGVVVAVKTIKLNVDMADIGAFNTVIDLADNIQSGILEIKVLDNGNLAQNTKIWPFYL